MEISSKMLNISGKLFRNQDRVMDDDKMRAIFEDHIPWLKERADVHRIDTFNRFRFKYDLHAYLKEVGIDYGYHWLYMRVNGYQYQWEFDENVEFLLFPKEQDISELIDQYAASRNSIKR